jgi:hypothetical protein
MPNEEPRHHKREEDIDQGDDIVEDDDDDSSSNNSRNEGHPKTGSNNDNVENENSSPSSSTKKKKKRKQRKKKKKKTTSRDADKPKHVSFGDIRIRSFARSFYSDGVPTDGGWPLGFSNEEPYEDAPEPISVEDYEIDKHARLEARWCAIAGDEALPAEPLETRQWDYKFGTKNPLFRALSEKARMHVIMGITEDASSPKAPAASPTSMARRTRSNSDVGHTNKNGSNNNNNNSVNGTRSSRRTRSGSYSGKSNSFSEDKDLDFEARHVMQELEALRNLRSKRGGRGCQCRKLLVYIPPPGSGKKAAHRRMKPSKVKEELRARNALPSENASREEMENLLLKLVQEEPCCGPDCDCVKNGIECQSETCSCWHAASNHVKDGTKPLACEEIEFRCGNPFGMVTVDFQLIDAYRAPFLTCLPVTISSEESSHATENEEKKMETAGD